MRRRALPLAMVSVVGQTRPPPLDGTGAALDDGCGPRGPIAVSYRCEIREGSHRPVASCRRRSQRTRHGRRSHSCGADLDSLRGSPAPPQSYFKCLYDAINGEPRASPRAVLSGRGPHRLPLPLRFKFRVAPKHAIRHAAVFNTQGCGLARLCYKSDEYQIVPHTEDSHRGASMAPPH